MIEESRMRFVEHTNIDGWAELTFEDNMGNTKKFHSDQGHWVDQYVEEGSLVKGETYIVQYEGNTLIEANEVGQTPTIIKGQNYIWAGAALVVIGIMLYMLTYPSVAWIMDHSLEEWMARNNQSIVLAMILAIIGAIINLYGLYLVYGKND